MVGNKIVHYVYTVFSYSAGYPGPDDQVVTVKGFCLDITYTFEQR